MQQLLIVDILYIEEVMPKTILIVEDESKLASILRDYLLQAGYVCHHIADGGEVIDWVKNQKPALILLDLMLPNKNGMDICKEIRQFSQLPIIMITAKVEEIDRLLGLELGADDYICKPFSPREVVARVKTVLRRVNYDDKEKVDLQLSEQRLTVTYHHQQETLTLVEFKMLQLMLSHPDWIYSREKLMDNIYSDHRVVNYRTIDSHIKKLRKKLASISDGKDWIQSVYGSGYRLNLTDD